MRYLALIGVTALLAVVLVGCGGGGSGIGDSYTTDSGLEIRDLRKGTGMLPQSGDTVAVHYTGWLEDGRQFDTSVGKDPFEFTIGVGQVIAGWDEGVSTMRVGGKRRLIVPSELAYGPQGNSEAGIPPDATLIFEIELLETRPLFWDSTETGLEFADMKVGTGESPTPGTGLVVHYTGWLEDGTKFDSSRDRGEPFRFTYGATPPEVITGWEEGLETMQVGGRRMLRIPPHLAYGESGKGSIPPNATLLFDVELLEIHH